VVVMENIFRPPGEGRDPKEATRKGRRRGVIAVIAATLASVIVSSR
jgi:multidrug efflux pump subunit AcrB